ncbi:hypothetical protein LP421_34070 (plasmid) [Rhizobium sp. RCAM05350]|nr:hypothetical protein LP421_34070 [Rhizobium sp. RCAM05350]
MEILALRVSIWSNSQLPQHFRHATALQAGFGLLMGICAAIVMLLPSQVGDGIFIDLRTTVISVSGFLADRSPWL